MPIASPTPQAAAADDPESPDPLAWGSWTRAFQILIVGALLVGVVAFIIGGIVFSGLMAVSPMAALITGALGDMGNLMGTLFGRFFGGGMYGGMGRGIGGGSSGPMMAGALGGGLLLRHGCSRR